MDPIRGKNVYIEFWHASDDLYRKFGCAQSISFDGNMKTKSVKTKGDGHWERHRGQSLAWTVSVAGLLLPADEPGYVTGMDLRQYWKQMVDIKFQMVFENEQGGIIDGISGQALVIKPVVTADPKFAKCNFLLQGNGEPLFGVPETCVKEIRSYTITRQGLTPVFSIAILTLLPSGTVPRYDWRLDGGAINSALDTGWSFNLNNVSSFLYGQHTIEIWPVCENGVRGKKLTRTFTMPFG